MEGEKRQKKKAVMDGASTPQKKKTRRPEKPVIGSSSTWKEEQLDLYRVVAKEAVAQDMIPAKWFEFSRLAEYQAGKIRLRCWLMLARDTLVSVQPSNLFSNSVLRKSVWFNYAFLNLRDLVSLKTTDSRKNYLAAKRREKRANKQDDDEEDSFPVESMPPPVSQSLARRVGPESSPEPEDEPPRIPSIADPDIPSAGSKLYHSCRETTTQSLGNHFCTGSLMSLFDPDPQLSWITGRHETPRLHWRDE